MKMKDYFVLQFKMLNRKIADFGMSVIMAYSILLIGFYYLSQYIIALDWGGSYLYLFLAIIYVLAQGGGKRNDFLKLIYNSYNCYKLRVLENFILSFPFLVFLTYKGFFIHASVLIALAVFGAFYSFGINTNFIMPTPFGNKPFEFTIGFRKTFLILLGIYFLTYMSVAVENFNLGIFSIISVACVCLTYYFKPEKDYFVWSFNLDPKEFLVYKIKISILFFALLSMPVVLIIVLFFIENILIIIGFWCFSFVYLITVVLAKYSVYPNKMHLPQLFLILLSFKFPPTLLVIIPYFYFQSIKKLNLILNDTNT